MEWKKYPENVPEYYIDVLVVIKAIAVSAFQPGDKYCAIDRFVPWNDGYPSSFTSERFYGQVLFWQNIPQIPNEE